MAAYDESWEFQNNTSARVLFKSDDFGEIYTDPETQETYPAWKNDFEARFPEDTYEDINGVELAVSDEVHWHDEAGYDEDGSMIVFTIVEENGDGYFNLATEDEDNPERWAYYTELEIV